MSQDWTTILLGLEGFEPCEPVVDVPGWSTVWYCRGKGENRVYAIEATRSCRSGKLNTSMRVSGEFIDRFDGEDLANRLAASLPLRASLA